ncbi:preprotein translocase subunit YajC [Flavobacteriaceae bacterium]|nr:preprotein translocase subunit YajC [Flavobacteriaceae bacterium]
MDFFKIQDAFASSAPVAATPQGGFASFIPLVVVFMIFYFLLIRPQQKKVKLQREMLSNLKNGNRVLTASGIMGRIDDINKKDNIVDLEIAEKTIIKITLDSINLLLPALKEDKPKVKKGKPKKITKTAESKEEKK